MYDQQQPLSIQTQIRCLECNDGTLMNRIPGTSTHEQYRCPKQHIRQLPKVIRIHVQRGGPRPPDSAA